MHECSQRVQSLHVYTTFRVWQWLGWLSQSTATCGLSSCGLGSLVDASQPQKLHGLLFAFRHPTGKVLLTPPRGWTPKDQIKQLHCRPRLLGIVTRQHAPKGGIQRHISNIQRLMLLSMHIWQARTDCHLASLAYLVPASLSLVDQPVVHLCHVQFRLLREQALLRVLQRYTNFQLLICAAQALRCAGAAGTPNATIACGRTPCATHGAANLCRCACRYRSVYASDHSRQPKIIESKKTLCTVK